MDQLPKEILTSIVEHLNFSDKINCVKVNRTWYHVIKCTNLYETLQLDSNLNKFHNAMNLFKQDEQLGKTVHHLEVDNLNLDLESILSLPGLFPNLTTLEWNDINKDFDTRPFTRHGVEIPSKEEQLEKWNQLRSIATTTGIFHIATALLESCYLVNLTYLNVSFQRLHLDRDFRERSIDRVRPFVKHFISIIKNAPNTEILTLQDVVLDLDDMEEIHRNAPKLQSLTLDNACVFTFDSEYAALYRLETSISDQMASQFAQFPASNIKALSIEFTSNNYHSMELLEGTISNWLIYINLKYNVLSKLSISTTTNYRLPLPLIDTYEQAITNLFHNVHKWHDYKIDIYPITKSIMDAIDDRDGRLERVWVQVDFEEQFEDQLKSILYSKQAESIIQLDLGSKGFAYVNDELLVSLLPELSYRMPSLTNLTMLGYKLEQNTLIEILQNLPELETLLIGWVVIHEDVVARTVKECKIKNLCIRVDSVDCCGNDQQINDFFRYVIQSCPVLEYFELSGDISCEDPGVLNLCFLDHSRLKSIDIDVSGTEYYTFSNTEGKQGQQWANYDIPLIENNLEDHFHIDIACHGKIAINLEEAPVRCDEGFMLDCFS